MLVKEIDCTLEKEGFIGHYYLGTKKTNRAIISVGGASCKTYVEHILQGFERTVEDGKSAFSVVISPLGRKLIRVIFEQREREYNEEERSRYVQQKAEEFGLI